MPTIKVFSVAVFSTALWTSACHSTPDSAVGASPAAVGSPTATDVATLATFSKRYVGTIGKLAVVLTLEKDSSGRLNGAYYYQRTRRPLALTGRLRGHAAELEEQDPADEITGHFAGTLAAAGWKGTWTNAKSGARLPVALHEDYTGAARLTFRSHEIKDCGVSSKGRPTGLDTCSVVSVRLPEIADDPALNEDLCRLVTDDGSGMVNPLPLDLQTWMQQLVAAGIVEDAIDVKVVNNGDDLLSLELNEYEDGGGAHPNHRTRYVNYDLRHHTRLRLRDLLVPGYAPRLQALGRRLFYEQNADNDMLDEPKAFAMNENFLIEPTGLRFQFNPYEAAAYLGSDPTVFITYRQLGKLLRPDPPVPAFIRPLAHEFVKTSGAGVNHALSRLSSPSKDAPRKSGHHPALR